MRQELAIRKQLIQTERLALVGRLLASVAHELNNPLQAIQNAIFLVKEEEGISEQGQQDLAIILSETNRLVNLIDRLRDTYRPVLSEEFRRIQLNEIVKNVHALTATHLRHLKVAYDFQPEPQLPTIFGMPDQLQQVILNLFMNAAEAMPEGGQLRVSTSGVPENDEILLSVSDTGTGIDLSILPDIFDAFVTSKESGTGLGLSISHSIVERHSGRIQAVNNPDGGATLMIWLPIHPREAE
jgi:signal transduction histidine kinase